jgi:hypothetical protein
MLCSGILLGVVGVMLILFGPEPWGPQIAIIAIAVAGLLVCGREWRKGL